MHNIKHEQGGQGRGGRAGVRYGARGDNVNDGKRRNCGGWSERSITKQVVEGGNYDEQGEGPS